MLTMHRQSLTAKARMSEVQRRDIRRARESWRGVDSEGSEDDALPPPGPSMASTAEAPEETE
ncbi:MAG: hypothetical protein VX181_20050, partial [Pseudomonadota bacterium]|nr:hypothetical protein [Pseudomonadota bacterium]